MEKFKRSKSFRMPPRPSAGVRLALHDLELCEQNPKYEINMYKWHHGKDEVEGSTICEVCEVCLGGSILARIEDNPNKEILSFRSDLSPTLSRRIRSMDCFRYGLIDSGVVEYIGLKKYRDLKTSVKKRLDEINVIYDNEWTSYGTNAKKFKKNLLEAADKLEAIGL